jgi:diguanylate cyclase (GGDEF)-like protein
MRLEQLAVLLALVVLAYLVLLVALVLPRVLARRGDRLTANGAAAGGNANGGTPTLGGYTLPDLGDAMLIPPAVYERVMRVVSYLFIGSALIVVTVTDTGQQAVTYILLALGAFLLVLGQDVLPPSMLGKWRYPLDALTVAIFVTALVALTGGHESPFFFGYLLLLSGASLWAQGAMPFVLALLASAGYLIGVTFVPNPAPLETEAFGRIAFNLVALALISYLAAIIGREQRRARESALRLSRFDVLTGLHNRAYFATAIEGEVLRAARTAKPFSLLLLDIDGLKTANDRYGHETGDKLLAASAEAIRGGIRASDFAARYGGDEFVVVLPDTDQQGALRVGEKLRFDISRLALRQNGAILQTSASIGLVTFPEDGRTSAELMRRVDLAMYEAKRRGRNQLVRFARQEERVPAAPEPAPATERETQLARHSIPIHRPATTRPAPWENQQG